MKKRLLSLLILVGILSMSITSGVYAEESKTLDLFSDFNQQLTGVDSISMYMYMTMDMEASGESFTMEMDGTISEVIRSETDIDMEMIMTTNMLGMEVPMAMYYKDGVFYQNAMEQKTKTVMQVEDVLSQVNLDAFNLSVPESAIKGQSTYKTDEGTEVSFILDGSELGVMLDSLIGNLGAMLGDIPEFSFGDVEITALIGDDDVLKSMEMSFDMEMVIEEETAYVSYVMYLEILQIGGITIEFPDDLDTYIEQELAVE